MKLLILLAFCRILLPNCTALQCYNGTQLHAKRAKYRVVHCGVNEAACCSYTIPGGYDKLCCESDFCSQVKQVAEELNTPVSCHSCPSDKCNDEHSFDNTYIPKDSPLQCVEGRYSRNADSAGGLAGHKQCLPEHDACCTLITRTDAAKSCCTVRDCHLVRTSHSGQDPVVCDSCKDHFCNDDYSERSLFEDSSDSTILLPEYFTFGSLVLISTILIRL